MKNIVLLGYMGTGKTAVSKRIARDLDRKYVSMDDEIEAKEGRDISAIFEESGEKYFRQREKELVRQLSAEEGLVIDTGGGVVLDKENLRLLEEAGICICLWASESEIYKRTAKEGHRPLLEVENPKMRIKKMLLKRRRFYERVPFHVDTTGKTIDEVTEEVKGIVKDEEKV